jgi:hypothetical protein
MQRVSLTESSTLSMAVSFERTNMRREQAVVMLTQKHWDIAKVGLAPRFTCVVKAMASQ